MSAAKRDQYLRLLERNDIVQTHVDAGKCEGMPSYLKGPTCLHIGLNMQIPIRKLKVTNKGIFADLSFNRVKYDVFMPWHAVVGLYAESMGPELVSAPTQRSNVVKVDFKKRKRI